jgi:hypothetical protein
VTGRARAVGPVEVRALVGDLLRRGAGPGTVALFDAEPLWRNDPDLTVNGRHVEVVAAGSVLAVHDAIGRRAPDRLVVVLTDRGEDELGTDVLARVVKHRRLPVDAWTLLRSRFSLGRDGALAPDLAGSSWLAEALVHHEPGDGWPALAAGFLDRATAWAMLRRGWLGLGGDVLHLADVLAWAAEPVRVASLTAATAAVRAGVLDTLCAEAGPAAGLVVELATTGRHDDLVPLGLVADVLWDAGAAGEAIAGARVRFEYTLGARAIDAAAAQAWGGAAVEVVRRRRRDDGRGAVEAWLVRAEQLLGEVGAAGEAWRSDVVPAGYEQRMAAVAAGPDGLDEAAAEAAGAHLFADRDRMTALRAALRLARRARRAEAGPGPGPGSGLPATLLEAAERYATDGAWVDAARVALRYGERVPALAEAYSALLAGADADREQENRRFAELLAAWSTVLPAPGPAGSGAGSGAGSALLPIERVLDEVVAPIVATTPVLLVVLDGAARSTLVEFATEVERAGWWTLEPEDRPMPVVVAALPTTTEVSRTSLLCGRLVVGPSAAETDGFAAHPALKTLRRKGESAPVLFHKGELTSADGHELPSTVRAALADAACPVVGVVVNAVDDHLDRGQQVRVRWGLDTLAPLGALLAAAMAARRTVILTADHGHVLDDKRSTLRPAPAGGERWRPAGAGAGAGAGDEAGDGEVVVAGPRVLQGDGRIVVPWTETLRYGGTKHGYHGGVTPQEVLVPLLVLGRPGTVPAGWSATRSAGTTDSGVPTTTAPAGTATAPTATPAPTATTRRKPAKVAAPQPDLFGGAPERAWIDALLASDTWASQRRLAGRAVLDDDRVRALLGALDARGGVAAKRVLATDTGISPMRIDTTLSALRRMLNVEGYPVLDVGDDDVRLDKRLLTEQFAL